MRKGSASTISMILLLLITIVIAGTAYLMMSSHMSLFTSKVVQPSMISHYCLNGNAVFFLTNVGTGSLEIDQPPTDFSSAGNLIIDSGFDSADMPGWEMPIFDKDVILLLDRSASMVGQGWPGTTPCITPCDELGYSSGDAYCAGETYPDCEDCDGRDPSLTLSQRRADAYSDHSVPSNIHYEEDCPYNEEKAGAMGFIGFMNDSRDRLGIISFSGIQSDYSSGEIMADLEQPLSFDYPSSIGIIDQMSVGYYTGIAAAIRYAMIHFGANPRQSIKSIVMLTDGEESLGGRIFRYGEVSSPLAEAMDAQSDGITIYTIGFGPEADEALLQQIADVTGGSYHYAATGEELEEVYGDIAEEIMAGIDRTVSVYGNSSLKFPANPGALFLSDYFSLGDHDHMVSQYLRIRGLQSGTLYSRLMLFEDEEDAENRDASGSILLHSFPAPVEDFNFTKFNRTVSLDEFDDECNGNPCAFGRLAYEWSAGTPSGTLWVDDVFVGEYVPYFDSISPSVVTLGDVTIAKSGDGDFYPYVSKGMVDSQSMFMVKDGNCASELCEYEILAGTGKATTSVVCDD